MFIHTMTTAAGQPQKEGFTLITIPTSNDISIEINGRKLAVAQSYRARSDRESKSVEAFGSPEPVGTVPGRVSHRIELTRVVIAESVASDGIDFHSLSDFNVVIVRPDCRIIYSGCQWASIDERASVGDMALESVQIVAAQRMELRA